MTDRAAPCGKLLTRATDIAELLRHISPPERDGTLFRQERRGELALRILVASRHRLGRAAQTAKFRAAQDQLVGARQKVHKPNRLIKEARADEEPRIGHARLHVSGALLASFHRCGIEQRLLPANKSVGSGF